MTVRHATSKPVLYVIACGGYPAEDVPGFVRRAQAQGWQVCVVGTRMGMRFLDVPLLGELTGYPVREDYKQPDDPDVLPPADTFVVAPATFNTINKVAAGISDTLALGLINEGIGLGKPVLVVPWPNQALARHPAFADSVRRLQDAGVRFVMDSEQLPVPSSGRRGAAAFPWDEVVDALAVIREQLRSC